jgi:hypothetical protein
MILTEFCEKLTNTKEEADSLYDSDNLYIVWTQTINCEKLNKFVSAIDKEYYRWCKEIRGDKRSEAKIDNTEGTLQGYAFNVDAAESDNFEQAALIPSMKYSYRFNTYNFNEIKEKEQQEIINALSEEE